METRLKFFTQGCPVYPRPITDDEQSDVLRVLHAVWPPEPLFVALDSRIKQSEAEILEEGVRHPQIVMLAYADGRPFMIRYEGEAGSQPLAVSAHWLIIALEDPDSEDDTCLF
ncbi:MAG: hypothetical protein RL150_265 [Candidatus Parcubacteria bacterium]